MTHKQIFPESWNLNQILYGLLVAYVFLLPIHLNLAIGLFLVMVVLNFANILKTGQFWPKVTVPKDQPPLMGALSPICCECLLVPGAFFKRL